MIITKRSISRRTVLRGLGATMGLPLLDAMVPALRPIRVSAASPTRRLATVYVPNGIIMDRWTPLTEGAGFDLPPTLASLAPFRDDLLVLSGLVHQTAFPLTGEGAGDHARAAACYLTGVHPKKTEGADIRAGVSMDQIAARHVGAETQLASLELGCDPNYFLGACDAGYSCAYGNTLSWRTETTPLPVEINPRAVFERMFGDAEDTSVAARRLRIQESVDLRKFFDLDSIVLVMRDRMMGVGNAQFRIGSRTHLARHDEGRDPGKVCLEREQLQVEHHLDVIVVSLRNTHRLLEGRQLAGALLLGFPDTALEIPNGLQVLRQLHAIGGAEVPLQSRDILEKRVQDASILLTSGCSRISSTGCGRRRTVTDRCWTR